MRAVTRADRAEHGLRRRSTIGRGLSLNRSWLRGAFRVAIGILLWSLVSGGAYLFAFQGGLSMNTDPLRGARDHAGRGDLVRAAKQYGIVNRIDLGETRSLRELASMMTRAERWSEADAALIRILKESPDDLSALQGLARVRIGQLRYGEASALLRGVLVENADDADSWNELGRSLALAGDFTTAEAAFRRAVALSTDPTFQSNADRAGRDAARAGPKPQ